MTGSNLTVAQAAALLGVSNRRVVAMIKSGILEAEKFGEKVWQISAESVERRRKAMASGKITAIWDDLESGWFMRIEDTTGDQIDEHLTLTEDEIENRELHDAVLNEEMDMALARNGREKKNYVKIIFRGE